MEQVGTQGAAYWQVLAGSEVDYRLVVSVQAWA
jgi:hypothetical protein